MSTYGMVLYPRDAAEYERLMACPSSLHGWFDPATGKGEVWFATQAAAMKAHEKGEQA